MKIRVALLVFICSMMLPVAASGQTDERKFEAFWSRFRTAVAANDKQAVASMTRLPFLFENKERDREAFIRIYGQLVDAKNRKCLAAAEKPGREGDLYEVFCGHYIFYFGKHGEEFKFLEFGVDY